jgi:hypothetical protein
MIVIFENFLKDGETNQLVSLWNETERNYSNVGAHFYFNNLIPIKDNIEIKDYFFKDHIFEALRLQKYDDTIIQNISYHRHYNPYNLVIYLNDNFHGGTLEFTNGVTVTPKKGMLVYFNENEMHRVNDHQGVRWSLVASSKKDFLNKIISSQPSVYKYI